MVCILIRMAIAFAALARLVDVDLPIAGSKLWNNDSICMCSLLMMYERTADRA